MAVALTVTLSGAGGALRQAPATAAAPAVLPSGHTYTVTLLTGDVVTVRTHATGCPAVTVRPADPHGVLDRSCGPDGHVRVVPGRVAGLIGPVLDASLFDVTTLILEGYDDARTKELPLIVRQAEQPDQRLAAPAAGLRVTRSLPSIGAVAARQPKAKGPDLIRALSAATARTPATTRKAAAATRVWLDHRVRATAQSTSARGLDANLGQVRAPQAWAAGYTGQGVKVAVLDTGADFAHPDLQGRIAARADFTVEDGDAADRHGHGTHVAATIAGSGVASEGQRRGVAPGARLLVGKVLGDSGEGTDSQVIAGMEWAAERADVVNMSLGGWEPSDGTDPMSLALDELTAKHGTLFVVAAGNDGPFDGTISSPAAAASALTVGAVDRSDRLADFSSRGPLVNTRAAKPELVAPGVDIVAARAAGTSLGTIVDARYTSLSGTSMAAPHAAGAAAILAQRHPGWGPGRLKAALVGAVDPLTGGDLYELGAGRLNAARPLHGVVSEQPIVALGTFTHPQTGTAETPLSWANTSGSAKTLRFGVTVTDRHGTAAPAGIATLSTTDAVVAPGGRGSTVLRIDRARLAARPGLHTAVVTARTAGGAVVSRTPVTFYAEPRSHDLTLTAVPLPDAPADADVLAFGVVVNLDDPSLFAEYVGVQPGEPVVLRVPAGRYSVLASLWDLGPETTRMGLTGDPEIVIGADTALVFDGSAARPVTAAVDGVDTVPVTVGITYEQTARRGPGWSDFAFAWGADAARGSVFTVPMTGPGVGTFSVHAAYGLTAPGDAPSPYLYDLIRPLGNGIPADPHYRVDAAEQARLARIDQRFHLLDTPDTNVRHKRYGFSPTGAYVAETVLENLPAQRTDYVTPGFAWLDEAFYPVGGAGFDMVTQEAQRTYAPGSRQSLVWVRQPMRTDWYDDPAVSYSGCRPSAPFRTRGMLHIELMDLTDQHQRYGCFPLGDESTSSLTLHRNGRLVGERRAPFGEFEIPQETADYRLRYDLDLSALLPVSTRVTTAWTFRSAGPSGTGRVPLPLFALDYALPLDAANHPTAGPGVLTVRQAHGVPTQDLTSFRVWSSLDDGATWQVVPVRRQSADSYEVRLPMPDAGQAVSLRVKAEGSAGSGIDQTVIRAYRAG